MEKAKFKILYGDNFIENLLTEENYAEIEGIRMETEKVEDVLKELKEVSLAETKEVATYTLS